MYDFSKVQKYSKYHFPDEKLEQKPLSVNNVLHVNFGNGVIILSFSTDHGVTSHLHSFKSYRTMKKIIEGQAQCIKSVSTQYPTGFGVGEKKRRKEEQNLFMFSSCGCTVRCTHLVHLTGKLVSAFSHLIQSPPRSR